MLTRIIRYLSRVQVATVAEVASALGLREEVAREALETLHDAGLCYCWCDRGTGQVEGATWR